MRSALYEGVVAHHRRSPVDHRFSYRVALPLLDLDELDEVVALHPLWSARRRNVVSFRPEDHLGRGREPLADAARALAGERLGTSLSGPVAVLAHPRTFGWVFNPISLYYCFDATGSDVEALVCEVTNTPWHERHTYVVGEPGTHRFDKAMHVSPFFPMDMTYELTYGPPASRLALRMCLLRGGDVVFDATMRLERREIDRQALGRLIFSYPFMTMRVSATIYRQAYALWRAGAPFVPHPRRARRGRATGPDDPAPEPDKEVVRG